MRGISTMAVLACFLAMASPASYGQSYAEFDSSGPLGVRLNHHDLKMMTAAAQLLLTDDSLPIGATREWNNPDSGDHGTVQLLKKFDYEYQGSKLPCREIRYHIRSSGNADPYNIELNRCKVADGSWKIL